MANDPHKARRRAMARAMQQAAMAELMALAAHEVNQPLAAIVANAGAGVRWLGREPADLDEARAAFRRIAADGSRAGELMRRLRQYTTPRTAPTARLDVRALVDEAWAAAGESCDTEDVILEARVTAGAIALQGDHAALVLALLNIMVNAADAMHGRGILTVEATPADDARIALALGDTGPGYPPGDEERIFAPFHSTTGGLGLGLPVARAIVEAHDGHMKARREGGRTIFTIFLPTAPRAP